MQQPKLNLQFVLLRKQRVMALLMSHESSMCPSLPQNDVCWQMIGISIVAVQYGPVLMLPTYVRATAMSSMAATGVGRCVLHVS
jgi:hypothetical protein